MSYDGLFLHAMIEELKGKILGGQVNKIFHPHPSEIILKIRAQRENHELLLSANPQFSRTHITKLPYENPTKASQFLMMLRKYLNRAHLIKIKQIENDRIIIFEFKKINELGDEQQILLVLEIMGRHSNIILTDGEKILDAVKHLPPAVNSYRTILPGAPFIEAPKQEKMNPFTLSETEWRAFIQNITLDSKTIQQNFQGFSSQSAKELHFLLNEDPKQSYTLFKRFLLRFEKEIDPTITLYDEKQYFTAFPYQTLPGKRISYDSLGDMLDQFFEQKTKRDHLKNLSQDLIQNLRQQIKRSQDKLAKLNEEYNQTEKMSLYKIKGEILTAYMHELNQGDHEVQLPNFYDQNEIIKITLDPKKTPAENAQLYFKEYRKLQSRRKHLQDQIPKTQEEIDYLQTVLVQIEQASKDELEDIKEELGQEGYLKKKNPKKAKKHAKKSQPESFQSTDGTIILVGKNNQQNDELTMKTAHKNDWWLHAKDIPGSHVVIRDASPSQETIQDAAMLAAHFSKYRSSSSVPVDITQIKHVKKPNGAKPGYVIYEQQRTLFVTPSEHYVDQLRRNQ